MTTYFNDLRFLELEELREVLPDNDFLVAYTLLAIVKRFQGVKIGKNTFRREIALFLLDKKVDKKIIRDITKYSNTSLWRLRKECL